MNMKTLSWQREKGMLSRWKIWWLGLGLAALVLAGCSGVLLESKRDDGRQERVKIDTGESWDTYDDKPRNPYTKKKTMDDMSIMLKREATF
jgi:hypothetical protein